MSREMEVVVTAIRESVIEASLIYPWACTLGRRPAHDKAQNSARGADACPHTDAVPQGARVSVLGEERLRKLLLWIKAASDRGGVGERENLRRRDAAPLPSSTDATGAGKQGGLLLPQPPGTTDNFFFTEYSQRSMEG
eukprot:gene6052-4352_t